MIDRDEFAKAVLPVILGSHLVKLEQLTPEQGEAMVTKITALSYKIADAMLKEQKKHAEATKAAAAADMMAVANDLAKR